MIFAIGAKRPGFGFAARKTFTSTSLRPLRASKIPRERGLSNQMHNGIHPRTLQRLTLPGKRNAASEFTVFIYGPPRCDCLAPRQARNLKWTSPVTISSTSDLSHVHSGIGPNAISVWPSTGSDPSPLLSRPLVFRQCGFGVWLVSPQPLICAPSHACCRIDHDCRCPLITVPFKHASRYMTMVIAC